MPVPQLILTLSPQGALVVELPGSFATRRKIELREADALATLRRILEAQAQDQTEIGLDGAPTTAQVKHWERHGTWPDTRCKFCVAEGRFGAPAQFRRSRSELVYKTPGGVEVRRLRPKQSGEKKRSRASRDAKELGL